MKLPVFDSSFTIAFKNSVLLTVQFSHKVSTRLVPAKNVYIQVGDVSIIVGNKLVEQLMIEGQNELVIYLIYF